MKMITLIVAATALLTGCSAQAAHKGHHQTPQAYGYAVLTYQPAPMPGIVDLGACARSGTMNMDSLCNRQNQADSR
jgi:uncharacterized protein YceK